jgi:2-haloalkanoic acid dehalogenase type II
MIYSDLLAEVHRQLAAFWGIAASEADHRRFGASVPEWPAFSDSTASLRYLKQHYKLVILSNVDRASFSGSNRRLDVVFDAIYTAQDVGSYKPALANFHYMLEHLGALGHGKGDILHTAQSLFHDHGPAKQMGLASAWIDRRHNQQGWGATMQPPEGASYDFHFPSLAAMVDAHRQELAV